MGLYENIGHWEQTGGVPVAWFPGGQLHWLSVVVVPVMTVNPVPHVADGWHFCPVEHVSINVQRVPV